MKDNIFLKLASYIIIPFLIIGIIFPIFYYSVHDKETYKNYFSSEYFNSEKFSNDYMFDLENNKRKIVDVLYNDYYYKVENNDGSIIYFEDSEFYSKAKHPYFLITYGNKVWTNVKLTSETDTYDKILRYISEREDENVKFVNINSGTIETNADAIKLYGIQSTSTYKDRKYTVYKYVDRADFKEEIYGNSDTNLEIIQEIENTENNINKNIVYTENLVSPEVLQRLKDDNPGVNIYEDISHRRIVFEFNSSDFNVYSSYIQKYDGEELVNNIIAIVDNASRCEYQLSIILPVSAVLLILLIVYLIIATGHKKNCEGIDLNDLDKIPFEIILLIDLILTIPLIICIDNSFYYENYKLFKNLVIGSYFLYYVLIAVNANTTIKRIKAKCFWQNTITGKIIVIVGKLLKTIYAKFKKIYQKTKEQIVKIIINLNTIQIVFITIVLVVLATFILILFGPLGLFIDIALIFIIEYVILLLWADYIKILKHLKRMYEGEKVEKIEKEKFSKYFENLIEYINNIQKGYENAIQEGIKSEKLKTELITNVSHDIKTPLTSIINYVDLLKQEKIESEKVNEYLNILESKSQRLKKLTEDLVDASKASSGNVSLNIEKLNVKELLKQSIGEFEEKFENKKLIIENIYPENNVYINADNRYIYRIIENLFSNISKYALDGTRVYIEVKNENKKVEISIKNISKEKLNISEEELVQRFVRGDKARTTEGSGLGLSISQSLTELQKGIFKLKIDGDLFKVTLLFDEV